MRDASGTPPLAQRSCNDPPLSPALPRLAPGAALATSIVPNRGGAGAGEAREAAARGRPRRVSGGSRRVVWRVRGGYRHAVWGGEQDPPAMHYLQ